MRERTDQQKLYPYKITRAAASMLLGTSGITGCEAAYFPQNAFCTYQEKSEEIIITTEQTLSCLGGIAIRGRAAKSEYRRDMFGEDWGTTEGCSTREHVLERDLENEVFSGCKVLSGELVSPYSGRIVQFVRGQDTSSEVQIDHIVSLSDAWQKGADESHMSEDDRKQLANDPKNLLAVYGPENQQKSDGDAATWLPPDKSYRCEMVASQVIVKQAYNLWMTEAEHNAIKTVLSSCPGETLRLPN